MCVTKSFSFKYVISFPVSTQYVLMSSLSFQHICLSKAGQHRCWATGTVEKLFLKLCSSYSFSELCLCLILNSAQILSLFQVLLSEIACFIVFLLSDIFFDKCLLIKHVTEKNYYSNLLCSFQTGTKRLRVSFCLGIWKWWKESRPLLLWWLHQ